jgi:hypothetical protein
MWPSWINCSQSYWTLNFLPGPQRLDHVDSEKRDRSNSKAPTKCGMPCPIEKQGAPDTATSRLWPRNDRKTPDATSVAELVPLLGTFLEFARRA